MTDRSDRHAQYLNRYKAALYGAAEVMRRACACFIRARKRRNDIFHHEAEYMTASIVHRRD